MRIIDVYAGIGGFTAGAMQASCTPILGVDSDDTVLRVWGGNANGAKCRCATLWRDAVDWPAPSPDIHVHLSPPCTFLTSARRGLIPAALVREAMNTMRGAINFVLEKAFSSWSIEYVNVWQVQTVMDTYLKDFPDRFSYTVVDAADHSVPSTRKRIIAGPPALITRLREVPVRRVSIRQAFEDAGLTLPALYIKNSTRVNGLACMRSVEKQAHTQTASHPLTWCTDDGTTVRCLTVQETVIVQGFPKAWILPLGSRDSIQALGNATCPPVACSIMKCAIDLAASMDV